MFAYLSRRVVAGCLIVAWAAPEAGLSCINTSYSRKHEQQITSDLPRLISGQFAVHGDAFYAQQLIWTKGLLELHPNNFDSRIDRAAALLKLQRYAEAESLLLGIEEDTPGQYKTHANLGVLYKKMGKFENAIHHTELALEIQPEGHLGLGDYYLRMLKWKLENPFPEAATANFLGVNYEDGSGATANSPIANEEWLKTLIISDRHYHDTYWVLGDVLFEKGDFQNALRCYYRAQALLQYTPSDPGMPRSLKVGTKLLSNRIGSVHDVFEERVRMNEELVFDRNYNNQIEAEIKAANRWLSSFQQTEAELVESAVTSDFDEVKAKMEKKGIAEPKYLELGVFEGKEVDGNDRVSREMKIAGAVLSLVILLFMIFGGAVVVRFFRRRLAR